MMSCCYSTFELLLLGTWPSACYQRVGVDAQLLDTYSAFEQLLGTSHLLPTTAWGRSLAATRPATLPLSYCLVRGHLLAVGDISIIFPCSFAVSITQQYGIHVLLG